MNRTIRAEYSEKIERAWTAMVAAQGRDKDMKRWVFRWKEIIFSAGDPDAGNKAAANDLARFLSDYNSGKITR